MGRGRAKAKQTKVARELKYHSPNTDLAALQRELGGVAIPDSDVDDDYDEYVDDNTDEGSTRNEVSGRRVSDDGNWATRHR